MQSSFPIHNPSSKRRLPTGPSSPQKVINTLHQTKTHHLDMHAIIRHGKINPQIFFFFFSFPSPLFSIKEWWKKNKEKTDTECGILYMQLPASEELIYKYIYIYLLGKGKRGQILLQMTALGRSLKQPMVPASSAALKLNQEALLGHYAPNLSWIQCFSNLLQIDRIQNPETLRHGSLQMSQNEYNKNPCQCFCSGDLEKLF